MHVWPILGGKTRRNVAFGVAQSKCTKYEPLRSCASKLWGQDVTFFALLQLELDTCTGAWTRKTRKRALLENICWWRLHYSGDWEVSNPRSHLAPWHAIVSLGMGGFYVYSFRYVARRF